MLCIFIYVCEASCVCMSCEEACCVHTCIIPQVAPTLFPRSQNCNSNNLPPHHRTPSPSMVAEQSHP